MARADDTPTIRSAARAANWKPDTYYGKQVELARGRKVAKAKAQARHWIAKLLRRLG